MSGDPPRHERALRVDAASPPDQAVAAWMDSIPAMDLFVCAVTKAEIEVGITEFLANE